METVHDPEQQAGPDPLIYLSTEFIRAKEYLEAIVTSTSDAICTTDLEGRIIYFSPGAERMLGKRAHEVLGLPVWKLYEGGLREAKRVMSSLSRAGTLSDHETVIRTPSGKRIHVSMSASFIRDRRGRAIGTLGISKDISRRVELEERLRSLSMTDDLTGICNHRMLRDRLPAEIHRARRQKQGLSLLLIDLDRFKEANDRWGHLEGDRILQDTARILSDSIRKDVDSAYRCGGDEFVVVLPGLSARVASRVADRIRELSGSRDYAELVTLSIGVASLRKGETPETLLRRADKAMYEVKGGRRRGPRRV